VKTEKQKTARGTAPPRAGGGEPLLPTADLLDVVFRNDGSAMDNSSSATPVRRMPSSRP